MRPFDEPAKKEQKGMAAIEAFRRGDEVYIKAPGSPIMRVLAVEGLKVRCADNENLQYWFDTVMLERCNQLEERREVSSVAIYESGLELSNPKQSSDFWVYAELLLRAPQTLAA
jgi:hypothetical protein